MKVLVLNCGSSSIKYKLFDMDHKEVIAQGGIEKIGLKGSFLKLTLPDGGKKILEKDIPEHTVGVEFILNTLISPEYGAIKSLDEINAVGHRMVHGGEKFSESVLLTQEVLDAFTACNDLAPLHNPANLKGVNAISAICPMCRRLVCLIPLSIRRCPIMPICMPFLTNCIRNTGFAVMASTELLTVMYQSVCANFWAYSRRERESLPATSVMVVPSLPLKTASVWTPAWV